MDLLIILDGFWPVATANGLCVDSIIKHFKVKQLTIVCRVTDKEKAGRYVDDYREIISIYCPRKKKFNTLGAFGKTMYVLKHIWGVFFGSLADVKLTDLYLNVIKKQLKIKKYDVVVTVLNPIEAVEVGRFIKEHNSGVYWIIYNLDTASNCSVGKIERLLGKLYYRKVFRWEKAVFEKADLIVHLESHKKHFLQERYRSFIDKMIFQGIPLLNIKKTIKKECVNNRLLYAGTFYHRLREPHILIDIANKAISIDSSIELDIYTKDESIDEINMISKSDNIHVYGFVNQERLDNVISSVSALISIGNKTTVMFPSKIISYLSTLKPIIHIYQNDKDPVIHFLEKYPNALLLDGRRDANFNAQKIIDFLQIKHRTISASEVIDTFRCYTGEYCAKEILGCMNRNREL